MVAETGSGRGWVTPVTPQMHERGGLLQGHPDADIRQRLCPRDHTPAASCSVPGLSGRPDLNRGVRLEARHAVAQSPMQCLQCQFPQGQGCCLVLHHAT